MLPILTVVVRCPGFPHRLAHEGGEAVADAAEALWIEAESLAGEGSVVPTADGVEFAFSDLDSALSVALSICQHLAGSVDQPTVALGFGQGVIRRGLSVGMEATRARNLVIFGRVGELLMSEAALRAFQLPDGVGFFSAPGAISSAVGHPVYAVKDYRLG